jgi:hypothetical protein
MTILKTSGTSNMPTMSWLSHVVLAFEEQIYVSQVSIPGIDCNRDKDQVGNQSVVHCTLLPFADDNRTREKKGECTRLQSSRGKPNVDTMNPEVNVVNYWTKVPSTKRS